MRKNNRATITMQVDVSYTSRDPLWDEIWRRLLAPVPATDSRASVQPMEHSEPSDGRLNALQHEGDDGV